MITVVVVNAPADWPIEVPEVEVVQAREYLGNPRFAEPRLQVVNLCGSYRYQSNGYYVSLLAEARGQRPIPRIETIQDLKSSTVARFAGAELDPLMQKSLASLHSDSFELSVYFGRNMAARHDALATELFRLFQTPLLRASFQRHARSGQWGLRSVQAVALREVPEEHREFVYETGGTYLSGRVPVLRPRRSRARYDLAILRDPSDPEPASNRYAIEKFCRAGEAVGFNVEVIGKDALARVPEFDALFIRDTTGVNHYTYRFARKAKAEGLVVIDEPELILKCLNKVYFAELMQRHRVPTPRTMVFDRRSMAEVELELGLPCVLKQPDSAFSAGVVKAATREEFRREALRLLDISSLVVAQEFRPTPFDWRIGVLDGHPLYACRYYMARRHWQIIERNPAEGTKIEGRAETLPIEQVPTAVVRVAVKAASLFGDSLFGVDVKQDERGVCVIEVNENPSIDSGCEDLVLKDELYLRVMRSLMSRVEQRKRARMWA